MGIIKYNHGDGHCPVCGQRKTHWHSSDELRSAGVEQFIKSHPEMFGSLPIKTMIKPVTTFTVAKSMLAFVGCAVSTIGLFRYASHVELSSPVAFAEWLGSSLGAGISLILGMHWFGDIMALRRAFNKTYIDAIRPAGQVMPTKSYSLHPTMKARFKAWRNRDGGGIY